jgi:hypothetical protein
MVGQGFFHSNAQGDDKKDEPQFPLVSDSSTKCRVDSVVGNGNFQAERKDF